MLFVVASAAKTMDTVLAMSESNGDHSSVNGSAKK